MVTALLRAPVLDGVAALLDETLATVVTQDAQPQAR